jgi:arginyl-tRNA synthetase
MNLKHHLDAIISARISEVSGIEGSQALINYAREEKFGDYQANGIMGAAKKLNQNPRQLGETVLENLSLEGLADKMELAGPGFINIFISADFLAKQLNALLESKSLVAPSTQQQTVVVDYSSPNLAKEMHVGHLRGTIIGDALARIFNYLGHTVIRQNHFGDWGTQFGMLITYMQELQGNEVSLENELADLEVFYRQAKQKFDADPEFAWRCGKPLLKCLLHTASHCMRNWELLLHLKIYALKVSITTICLRSSPI